MAHDVDSHLQTPSNLPDVFGFVGAQVRRRKTASAVTVAKFEWVAAFTGFSRNGGASEPRYLFAIALATSDLTRDLLCDVFNWDITKSIFDRVRTYNLLIYKQLHPTLLLKRRLD